LLQQALASAAVEAGSSSGPDGWVLKMQLQVYSLQTLERQVFDQIDRTPSVLDCDSRVPLVVASRAWVDEDHQFFYPDVEEADFGLS
jgi:hypothetical protein